MHRKVFKPLLALGIMKTTNKIKSRDKVVKTYWINCPECGREIKGNSESHVEVNFKFHLDKHIQLKKEEKK